MAAIPSSAGPVLTARDLAQLDSALATLNQLVLETDQAEQAGRDVSVYRARIQDLYTQAMQVKSTYFPQAQ
jgi:hypothetical protein